MATLKDVAQRAAVSTSTASRILHGGAIRVSEETRTRVLEAADALMYRPNATARSLRTRLSRTVGLLIPDITNPIYAQIIDGAEAEATNADYAVLLMNARSRGRRQAFLELLSDGRLDGLIIADANLDDELVESLEDIDRPFVLVNRRSRRSLPYVILDEIKGAGVAIQHLVSLGHRSIGYIAGPSNVETSRLRREGVRVAGEELRVPVTGERVQGCDFDGQGVPSALERLLAVPPRVTAIATANTVIAFAVLRELQRRGFRVPHDISVIGYHDTPLAEFITPSLTTVEMPLRALGSRAMTHVLARIQGETLASEVISVPGPLLVKRESTAPPR